MEYWDDADIAEARANGIEYAAFYSRVAEYGWTVKDAKTTPVRSGRMFDDEIFRLAEKNDIPIPTLYNRVRKHGWTPEKAATTKLKKRGRPRNVSTREDQRMAR